MPLSQSRINALRTSRQSADTALCQIRQRTRTKDGDTISRKPSEFIRHPFSHDDAVRHGEYRAVCRHITDGDTFDFFVSLGLDQYAYLAVRLKDVDTPELFRPKLPGEKQAALSAKSFVEHLIFNNYCRLKTYKDRRSFNRYIADVSYWQPKAQLWVDLAGAIKQAGHEKRESYERE